MPMTLEQILDRIDQDVSASQESKEAVMTWFNKKNPTSSQMLIFMFKLAEIVNNHTKHITQGKA